MGLSTGLSLLSILFFIDQSNLMFFIPVSVTQWPLTLTGSGPGLVKMSDGAHPVGRLCDGLTMTRLVS